VDEDFSGGSEQGGPEACNVPQMKEGSFGDVVDMGEEREGGVKDDAEVADLSGGGDDGAIDIERDGLGRAGEGVRADDEYFKKIRAAGFGGVLSQARPEGERVVGYFSRVFNNAERRYCVTCRELLAVVLSIKYYLCSQTFTVRTDHSALQWLRTFKEPEGSVGQVVGGAPGF